MEGTAGLEMSGRRFFLLMALLTAIVASCEAVSGGHVVEDVALRPLEICPEPVCPEPICPACSEAVGGPAVSSGQGPIDLNTATAAQLDTLPGVGSATAERILAHRARRPFRRARDLMRVRGIGPSKYRKISPHVIVGPAKREVP